MASVALTSLVVRTQMRGQQTLHDRHVFCVPVVEIVANAIATQYLVVAVRVSYGIVEGAYLAWNLATRAQAALMSVLLCCERWLCSLWCVMNPNQSRRPETYTLLLGKRRRLSTKSS